VAAPPPQNLPPGVAVADFNGDGKADPLWENFATGDVGYSAGNGASPPLWHPLGTAPAHFIGVS
jgi:hypothetical protein